MNNFGDRFMFIVFFVAFTLLAAPMILAYWIEKRCELRNRVGEVRGFEVEKIAGSWPVLNEKENDHG